MKSVVPAIVLFVFVAAWFGWFRPLSLGGDTSYLTVSGVSMEPTMYSGDLVLTRRQSDYAIGDIVAFRVGTGNVIHRIVGGNAADGFVMQGDNRDTVDQWQPTPEEVVGKSWVHIPSVGGWVTTFREPLHFALLMGALSSLAFIGSKKKRRHRNGRWAEMDKKYTPPGLPPSPAWLLGALAAGALLTLAFAAMAYSAWRTDTERNTTLETLSYEHAATYTYTAEVEPSALYPDGLIGPVTAETHPAGEGELSSTPPLYWSLEPRLHLALDYALLSDHPLAELASLSGEVSSAMVLQAGNQGWRRSFELVPPTAFEGGAVSVELPIDLAELQGLIVRIEEETGFSPPSYELSVLTTVHIDGEIAGESVSGTFEVPLSMSLTRTQIGFDGALAYSEPHAFTQDVASTQQMSAFGLSMPVATARLVAGGVFALAAVGTGLMASMVFLGIGRGEWAQIRARYGSMLVSVADSQGQRDTEQVIRLATIHDLVRLAKRDARMILHHRQPNGDDEYFVQDGGVTYLYTSPAGRPRAASETQEA